MKVTIHVDPRLVVRRSSHDEYVIAMREGRRQRATTFKARKGKGSYTRRTKHRGFT